MFLLGSFMAETGCGRKGPPLPPEIRVADTTRDLRVVQDEETARLQWSYPQMTAAGGPLPDLESVEVWRAELLLAQEPPPGMTARDRATRQNLLEGRGEIIASLEGDGLDRATQGSMLVFEDALGDRVTAATGAESSDTVIWYAVRSVCCRGRHSDFSNIVRVVPLPAPSAPEGLEIVAERGGPQLQWTAIEGQKVLVERSSDGQAWEVVSPSPLIEGEWVDVNAVQGKTWYYRLRSVIARTDGTIIRKGAPGSSVRVDFPDLYPPGSPIDLVCLPEAGRVRLRWRAADGATGYSIERQHRKETEMLAEAISEISFVDEKPPSGTVKYTVWAVDAAGNRSEPSSCKTIAEGS